LQAETSPACAVELPVLGPDGHFRGDRLRRRVRRVTNPRYRHGSGFGSLRRGAFARPHPGNQAR
jgi:hypothetical protein